MRAAGRGARAWLPDHSDELLLTAGLADDPALALDAWQRWRRASPLEIAGSAAFEIFPLVYRNLSDHGSEDPELARLRGVYRHTWSHNQVLYWTGGRALQTLEAAGIETMVLKGAALGPAVYGDPGVRRMLDFDVLVRPARALDAIEALRPGFVPVEDPPNLPLRIPGVHSGGLVDAEGREIDLHWYVLWQSSPDDDFWDAAVPADVAGVDARILSPPDQLLHVCVHGSGWPTMDSIRWVADAVTLIRTAGDDIDWDRLVEQARIRQLTLPMLDALSYLAHAFGAPVPDGTLRELRDTPRPVRERLARRAGRRRATPARILVGHWDRYRRLKALDPTGPRGRTLPAQLKGFYGARSYPALLRRFGRRLVQGPPGD
jgi:Uncharacterised nucleotidyltransferase